MATPLLYRLGHIIGRVLGRAYFRDVEVGHPDRMPADGPVILAANHPQSITDALILGLASPRVIHFVAHSGLFHNPLQAALLRSAGAIPIHRRDPSTTTASGNKASFEACCRVLGEGGCVGIFPEGTSQQERRVQRLKTGTARIALEAENEHGFALGLKIVPVGLNFQSRRRFRSRVLVLFAHPIEVAQYRDAFLADAHEAARQLTDALQDAIRHRVVDVRQTELEDFVRRVERVYKHELRERPELDVAGLSRLERDQFLAREIARATDWFYAHQPERIWGIAELLEEYQRKLDRLGIADRMLRDEGPGFAGTATRMALAGLAGLPIAAWGLATGFIPWWLTTWTTRLLNPDPTKTHTTQLATGAVYFGAFYLAVIYWFAQRTGLWPTLFVGLSLPLSGLFARTWLAGFQKRRKHLRFAYLQGTRGLMIQKLRTFRREILDAMDEALKEYMERDTATEDGRIDA